jgi:PIN domain nuclease of toxin-antitoxin system
VRYLLDTCTLLWFANGDRPKLPVDVQTIFTAQNAIAVSTISLWELAMKAAVGKQSFPGGSVSALTALCARQYIDILPLTPDQIQAFLLLPSHHSDPFDRLIAAVSLSESTNPFVVLSPDTSFDAYASHGVVRVW